VAARSKGLGLRPLACWNCGFESHRRHGCLSLWVFYQVQVSAMGRSLVVQRSPTDCGGSECDRGTSQRKPRPTRAVEPWKRDKVRKRSQAVSEAEFIRRESWSLRSNHPYHRCWENHENLVGAYWWPGENFWKKIKLRVRRFSIGWFVCRSICWLKVMCLQNYRKNLWCSLKGI
jgi:hypothetical protein